MEKKKKNVDETVKMLLIVCEDFRQLMEVYLERKIKECVIRVSQGGTASVSCIPDCNSDWLFDIGRTDRESGNSCKARNSRRKSKK